MSFPGLSIQPRATCPVADPRDVAERALHWESPAGTSFFSSELLCNLWSVPAPLWTLVSDWEPSGSLRVSQGCLWR